MHFPYYVFGVVCDWFSCIEQNKDIDAFGKSLFYFKFLFISSYQSILIEINIDRKKIYLQLMNNYAFDGKLIMHNGISNFIRSEEMFDFFWSRNYIDKLGLLKWINVEKFKSNELWDIPKWEYNWYI